MRVTSTPDHAPVEYDEIADVSTIVLKLADT